MNNTTFKKDEEWMYSNFDIFMSLVIREQEQSTHVHVFLSSPRIRSSSYINMR